MSRFRTRSRNQATTACGFRSGKGAGSSPERLMRQLFLAQRVQTRARYAIVPIEPRHRPTAFIDAWSLQVNRKILFLVAGFFLMILPVAVVAQTATTSPAATTSSAAMTTDAV